MTHVLETDLLWVLQTKIVLIGRLTKDQEVIDIWLVSELLNAYINVFFVKFDTGGQANAVGPYITEL